MDMYQLQRKQVEKTKSDETKQESKPKTQNVEDLKMLVAILS